MIMMAAVFEAIVLLLALPLANAQAIKPVSSSNSSKPTVDLGYAKYQGWTNKTAGVSYFRGLQYEFCLNVST